MYYSKNKVNDLFIRSHILMDFPASVRTQIRLVALLSDISTIQDHARWVQSYRVAI